MWNALTHTIMNMEPYTKVSRRNRAQVAYGAVYITFILFTIYALTVPFQSAGTSLERHTLLYRALRPASFPLYSLSALGFYAVAIYTLVNLWRGHVERVTLGPSLMLYIGAVGIAVSNNLAYAQNAYLLIPSLLLAGVLDGDRGLLVFAPLHFVTLLIGYSLFIGVEPLNTLSSLVLLVIVSVALVGIIYLYLQAGRVSSGETEAGLVQQRLRLARLTTRITRSIAEPEDLSEVLNAIVDDIREAFPEAYHAQVFLLDEDGRFAKLVASTGEPGRKLLEMEHSLPVGSASVIGFVTQQQRAYRTVVGAEGQVHRPNPLLPETQLEVALPLNAGTRNIGALDLQSKDPDAFPPSDLTTLQAIADAIAVTINNARLLEATNERLRENQRLLERMSATQEEVERLNRELTGAIWADYLRGGDTDYNLDLDFEENETITSDELSAALMDAIERDDIVREVRDGRNIVAVPLRVRGEVIGAMEFEVESEISVADLDMLREVGERFGLAAENNRLYENSQRVAQREALVNEISTRMQSANSVDATMAEAARSLRDALKANRVAIRLGTPTTTARSTTNGKE